MTDVGTLLTVDISPIQSSLLWKCRRLEVRTLFGLIAVTAMLALVLWFGRYWGIDKATKECRSRSAAHNMAVLRRRDAVAAPGKLVFLGSSTVESLDTSAVASHALNLGLGGDRIETLLARARRYESVHTARGVVLNIGINDVLVDCQPIAMAMYRAQLQALARGKPLIWLGLQPLRGVAAERCNGAVNRFIDATNELQQEACRSIENCLWVEHPLRGKNVRRSSPELLEADGIHMRRAGYAMLEAALAVASSRLIPQ